MFYFLKFFLELFAHMWIWHLIFAAVLGDRKDGDILLFPSYSWAHEGCMHFQIHVAEKALICDSMPDAFPLPQGGEVGPSECKIFFLLHQMRGGTQSDPHRNAVIRQVPNSSAITRERV